MSGLPWTIGNSGAGNAASAAHAFVTVGAAPAGDTTLLDVSFGTSGYLRAKVTSALHIVLESSYQGQLLSNDLGAIQVSQYYWLGCMAFAPLNTGTVVLRGQVWAPGAQLLNSRDVSGGTTITTSTLTAVVGAGETVSGSGYAGFPAATAGWSLSKVLLENVINATLFTPLTADPAPDSGTLGLYLCRQAPGAAATLIDATSAHRDLTAAAGGLTILAAGPYA